MTEIAEQPEVVQSVRDAVIPPKKKLWQALHNSEFYTKSYEDFDKQFSTPEQVGKLHSALHNADYYTKPVEDFTNQFFSPEKKSTIGNAVQPTSPSSNTGSHPFQSSLQNTNDPLGLGQAQSIGNSPAANPADRVMFYPNGKEVTVTDKIDPQVQYLRDANTRKLAGNRQYMASVLQGMQQKRHSDILALADPGSTQSRQLVADEKQKQVDDSKNDYKGNISLSDRLAAGQNSLTRGMGSMAKGVFRTANTIAKAVTPDALINGNRYDEALQKYTDAIDGAVKFVSDLHPLKDNEEATINKSTINGAINGLAEFAPAVATAERTGGMSFFFNDYEKGYENIDKISKDKGLEISEPAKQVYAITQGAISATLMTHNLHHLLGNANERATQSIIDKASNEAIGYMAKKGEDFSHEALKKASTVTLDNIENRVKNYGIQSLKGTATSVGDMTAMEALKIGTDKLANTATGKRVFNTDDAPERMQEAIKNGALFGAAGAIVKSPTLLSEGSPERNSVIESLYKDTSPENVQNIKGALEDHLTGNGLNTDDISHAHNIVDQII